MSIFNRIKSWLVLSAALCLSVGAHAATTHLADGNAFASGTTVSSTSISPDGDALLIAFTYNISGFGAKSVSSVVSDAGLNTSTWTLIAEYDSTGANRPSISAWWAIADSSAGSGTVTATWDDSTDTRKIFIAQIDAGFDSSTPIRAASITGGAITTDASPQFTLPETPASDSILFSAWTCNDADSGAPDSGWTELNDTAGGNVATYYQYAAGSNGTSAGVTWTGSTQSTQAYIGFEVVAPSSSTSIPVLHHQLRNQ